jgi:UDP-N-acetylmuramyl pentapeptide phosphotransferase/UDP-N-acetylglucosamine-1-phosphate transferase
MILIVGSQGFLGSALVKFFKKKIIKLDKEYSKPQSFHRTPVLCFGGSSLYIIFTILFFLRIVDFNFFLLVISAFFIGLIDDIKIKFKPKFRLIFIFFLFFIVICYSNIIIKKTGIDFLDYILKENKFFNFFFVLLCFVFIINGSNFIDGVNNLLSGYYLIVIILVIYIFIQKEIKIDFDYYYYLLISLSIFFIFNMFNKIYLGDSGSYLLSFFIGILLINLSNINGENISPLFIALLLWYPAFENLFSIIRKLLQNRKIYNPDNLHLHHMIFSFFKKKFKNKNLIIASSLTGNVINLYNLLIFFVSLNFINSTKYLIIIIGINILIYIFTYYTIKRYLRIF